MKNYICFFLFICLSQIGNAQRRNIPLNQADPRFTIRAESFYNFVHDEYYYFYVKNNTNETYRLVVDVTVTSPCFETRNYKLGVNRVIQIGPGEEFTPSKDYAHIFIGGDNTKTCRIKVGDTYTFISGIRYTYSEITNVTQENVQRERENAEKEKERLAQEAKKKEELEKARLEKEEKARLEKEEREKKARIEQETREKKAAEEKNKQEAETTEKSALAEEEQKASEEEQKRKEREEYQQSQDEAVAAARRTEEARKRAEEEAKQERQKEYDEWKAKARAHNEQLQYASAAASASFLYFFGGIIYENMDDVNPNHIYKSFEKGVKFYSGTELGFSGTYMPLIFNSEYSSMFGGEYQIRNELISSAIITINLDLKYKLGIEHNNGSAHAYIAARAGSSPLFEAGHISPFNYGGNITAGIKWVKLYGDYSRGSRNLNNIAYDPSELGAGRTYHEYTRLKYGLRISTKPDSYYSRGHFTAGLIDETITVTNNVAYLHPENLNLVFQSKSPKIQGYFFEYKKDHNFNIFINVFPEYVYSGEINSDSGRLSSDFIDTPSSVFVELGFIRVWDFWK